MGCSFLWGCCLNPAKRFIAQVTSGLEAIQLVDVQGCVEGALPDWVLWE